MELIPAYDTEQMEKFQTKESYITESILATTEQDIVNYIESYMNRNTCSLEVIDFLTWILNHRQYTDKIQLVNDGSWRNVAFLVRPDGFMKTHGKTEYENFENQITDFYKKAEMIFINMTDETWNEVYEWDKLWLMPEFDYTEDEYDYHPVDDCDNDV
jgi:hypothetical protein